MNKITKKINIKSFTVYVLLLSILFNSFSNLSINVNAESNNDEMNLMGYTVSNLSEKESKIISSKINEDLISRSNERIKEYNSTVEININEVEYKKVIDLDGSEKFQIVYGVKGSDIDEYSKVNYIFDVNGKLLTDGALIANIDSDGSISANMLVDGKLTMFSESDANGDNVKTYEALEDGTLKEIKMPKGTFSCITKCLEQAGYPLYIISLVIGACSVACAITLGIACYGCLMGLSWISAGSVSYCYAKCE